MAMLLESSGVSLLHHGSSRTSTVAVVGSSCPRSSTRLPLPGCFGLRRITSSFKFSSSSSASVSRRASGGIVCEQKQGMLATEGEVSDKTWKERVLESDIPVLVDFWAPWCGPCRMIAPLVDELAKKYEGRVRCLKLNTDESPSTATEYGIRSIPTVMIFKGGVKKDTIIGAVPMAALVTAIEKYLDR